MYKNTVKEMLKNKQPVRAVSSMAIPGSGRDAWISRFPFVFIDAEQQSTLRARLRGIGQSGGVRQIIPLFELPKTT
jgi:hypothetical protein